MRGVRLVALGAAVLLCAPSPAGAHDPLGRAQPRVDTTVKGSGLVQTVVFRVRDVDSGRPIPAATLSVDAVGGRGSTVGCDPARVGAELFRCRLDLPQPGDWTVRVRVGGEQVVPTSFSFDVQAVGSAPANGSSGGPDVALIVGVGLAVLAAAGLAAAFLVRRRRA